MVCSAAERMLDCGALTTMTPRRVAAATSTLSRPMPARPTTTRSGAASSTAAVTWVAERMIRAWADPNRVQQFRRRQPDRHVDLVPGLTQQRQSRLGDLLGDRRPVPRRRQPATNLARRVIPSARASSPRAYENRA